MKFTATAGMLALGLALATAAAAQTTEGQATDATAAAASDDVASPSSEGIEMAKGATKLPNGQDIAPANMENGRWYTEDGIPTFKIEADGTVDYSTFSGYRRYSAECHVCHGPDGEGSTYAPPLKDSVLKLDYYQYQEIVASGKQDISKTQNLVMPAFGTNKNVWCYVDDIYVYLLARGTGEIPRGRPAKKAEKTPEFTAQEDSCMNG